MDHYLFSGCLFVVVLFCFLFLFLMGGNFFSGGYNVMTSDVYISVYKKCVEYFNRQTNKQTDRHIDTFPGI